MCRTFRRVLKATLPSGQFTTFPHPNYPTLIGLMNKLNEEYAALSDLIVWEGSYKRKKENLKDAFAAITNDKKIVEKFLSNNGVLAGEIVFGPVSTEEVFETIFSQNGDVIGEKFMGYNLSQDVMIESNNVLNIEKVSRKITEVLNNGSVRGTE